MKEETQHMVIIEIRARISASEHYFNNLITFEEFCNVLEFYED